MPEPIRNTESRLTDDGNGKVQFSDDDGLLGEAFQGEAQRRDTATLGSSANLRVMPASHQLPKRTTGPGSLRASIEDRLRHFGQMAQRTGRHINHRASNLVYYGAQTTKQVVRRAQLRSQVLGEEASSKAAFYIETYPLRVIAGVAGTAFLTGVALRIWRSSRYER